MFETAKWIARERDIAEHPAPILRRTFTAESKPARATLFICALGYGTCWLNGKPVTQNLFTTPFTRYDCTVLYQSYDVSELLVPGENVLGLQLGNGFYNDAVPGWNCATAIWRHAPKVIFQLEMTAPDGTQRVLCSDTKVKTAESALIYNHARCGEIFDARKRHDGWLNAGYDDSHWTPAVITHDPGGVLKPDNMPPINAVESIAPISAQHIPADGEKPDVTVYDFGKNISGFARITLKAKPGREIHIAYSDRLLPGGRLDRWCVNRFNDSPVRHEDTYIAAGGCGEEWQPSFVYHGFRYAEVTGECEQFSIRAVRVHTNLQSVGEFSCSDEMLNKIHAASRLSTLTNWFSIPTDCPHREQNGWTGDAQIASQQSLMNFDMREAYRKWLLDFKDAQRPSGQLPGIVPTSGWAFSSGGPAWDSAVILIPYNIYRLTGDLYPAREMWENMGRYLHYLETKAENGLLIDFYSLPDWCPPADAKRCPKEITDNAYFYSDACKMAELARALGYDDAPYRKLAQTIRTAYRARFIHGAVVESDCQTAQACALYEGLFEESEKPQALQHLVQLIHAKEDHTDCGIMGMLYCLSVLSENGYAELMYRIITNPTMPSYAYWIQQGMTTLCEDWAMKNDAGDDSSLNHQMFSSVDYWFYRYLAGIHLSPNGLTIEPCFIPQLRWVKASHNAISVFWDDTVLEIETDRPATVRYDGRTVYIAPGKTSLKRGAQ